MRNIIPTQPERIPTLNFFDHADSLNIERRVCGKISTRDLPKDAFFVLCAPPVVEKNESETYPRGVVILRFIRTAVPPLPA